MDTRGKVVLGLILMVTIPLVGLVPLLVGQGGLSSPERTVQRFFDCWRRADLAGIRACCTPDMVRRERIPDPKDEDAIARLQAEIKRRDKDITPLKIVSVEQQKDRAIVKTSGGMRRDDETEFILLKTSRGWLIDETD
jgi:hypothetical protein